MAERCQKMSRPTKFDKVVRRSICETVSVGTRTFDTECADSDPMLIAFCEEENRRVGVCIVKPNLAKIFVGVVSEDRSDNRYTNLAALLSFCQVEGELVEMLICNQFCTSHLRRIVEGFRPLRMSRRTMPQLDEIQRILRRGHGVEKEENHPLIKKLLTFDSAKCGKQYVTHITHAFTATSIFF